MANLTYRRIAMEDIKGAPEWMATVLNALNLFLEQATSAINGNLTFADNVDGMQMHTTFTTPLDYLTGGFPNIQFTNGGTSTPSCCMIGKISNSNGSKILTTTSLQWTYLTSTNPGVIKIDYIAGLEANKTYTVNLLAC